MTFDERVRDIKEHPVAHRHDYDGLVRCCLENGAISLALLEAHGEHVDLGRNGGVRCDVTRGPCACGAWHW